MEKDFHYYAVYKLAKLAGFSDENAETISYASQYVDDSTESEPIEPRTGQHFDTVRTAHYNIGAYDWNIQKKVYMPFHFLPSGVRWENPDHFTYVTSGAKYDESDLAVKLINDALPEHNTRYRLIRIGVAIHTIADTLSHFGFSGRHNEENNVGNIWHKGKNDKWHKQIWKSHLCDIFMPRIGHAEALKFPDQPFLHWKYKDSAGKPKIRINYDWCMKGAELIYELLCRAGKNNNLTGNLKKDHSKDYSKIKTLFKKGGSIEVRCKNWAKYTNAPDYDKTKWRKAAVTGDVNWDQISGSDLKSHLKTLKGKKGFDDSKWAFFHRAAHKQRSLVLEWLN